MPSLTYEELLNYSPIPTEIFVETGTFGGDTVYNMLNYFHKIYSIELSHELADRAKSKFSGCQHVSIIQGDSSVVLREICKNIDKPTFSD